MLRPLKRITFVVIAISPQAAIKACYLVHENGLFYKFYPCKNPLPASISGARGFCVEQKIKRRRIGGYLARRIARLLWEMKRRNHNIFLVLL